MTYETYVNTPMPQALPERLDEPHGFCGKCGLLCHFTEEPYTGLKTSTCCGATPYRPRLV